MYPSQNARVATASGSAAHGQIRFGWVDRHNEKITYLQLINVIKHNVFAKSRGKEFVNP